MCWHICSTQHVLCVLVGEHMRARQVHTDGSEGVPRPAEPEPGYTRSRGPC